MKCGKFGQVNLIRIIMYSTNLKWVLLYITYICTSLKNVKIPELLDQYYVLLEIEFETVRVKCYFTCPEVFNWQVKNRNDMSACCPLRILASSDQVSRLDLFRQRN